jgi:hypothetical protein
MFDPVTPPILIYQMGKVGSATVYETLKKLSLPNPLYHIHFLSSEGLANAEALHLAGGEPLPNHIHVGKAVRMRFLESPDIRYKIITLVRDPIATSVSSTFYNLERLPPKGFDKTQPPQLDQLMRHMQEKLAAFDQETNYITTWFDKELKTVFNADIYLHPFDHEAGYSIISYSNVDVLVFKLEDLDSCMSEALTKFLSLDHLVEQKKSNTGAEQKYHEVYRSLQQDIVIPKAVCERIYVSKFACHFYTDTERHSLIEYWSKERKH